MTTRSGARRAAPALGLACALAAAAAAAQEGRVVLRVPLEDGRVVVVAEGDLEPRSVGSYTVRLYAPDGPSAEQPRFVAAMTRPREGVVERLLWHDFDRDRRPELVVVIAREGAPASIGAEAYSFGRNRIVRRATVERLAPGADPVGALAPRVRRATAP